MQYQSSTSSIGLNLLETSNGMYQLTAPVTLDELLAITSRLTDQLSKALDLVGVRLLDHIVIGGTKSVSFAERGWL